MYIYKYMYFLFQQDAGSRYDAGQDSYKGIRQIWEEERGTFYRVSSLKSQFHTHKTNTLYFLTCSSYSDIGLVLSVSEDNPHTSLFTVFIRTVSTVGKVVPLKTVPVNSFRFHDTGLMADISKIDISKCQHINPKLSARCHHRLRKKCVFLRMQHTNSICMYISEISHNTCYVYHMKYLIAYFQAAASLTINVDALYTAGFDISNHKWSV